jgi:membrane-associated phospholipid phosphatase
MAEPYRDVVDDVVVSPRGEEAALVAVQSALADRPGVLAGARALSHFGEHSIGWLVLAAIGALLQPGRRRAWLAAGVGAFIAHAAAVVIKRVVRRERPHHPAIAVNVGTPSRLSFPSAHATSTTAASILMARATGLPLPAVLVPPMALSRLVLGRPMSSPAWWSGPPSQRRSVWWPTGSEEIDEHLE